MINAVIERIQKMENILDTAHEMLDALETASAELKAYQSEIRKHEAYYTSEDWKNDYALEEAGKLPADLKRGVLSEDGVYNMLERNRDYLNAFSFEEMI